MKIEDLKTRINELISLAEQTLATEKVNHNGTHFVSSENFSEYRSAVLSFLRNTFGDTHPFYVEFERLTRGGTPYDVKEGRGILKAVKQEIDGGWIFTVKALVSAEIFSDFLEMAGYLLSENYKDPAAVMTGSVLEEHLRQLCLRNSIPTEAIKAGMPVSKKAEMLNSELSGNNVYNKLDQKTVTSWLDLRNKAAHGKYSDYSQDQVSLMFQGVSCKRR